MVFMTSKQQSFSLQPPASSLVFSVITPSFNQGRYLTSCLESVKNQGVDYYEHIIIDNCSTDETKEILAAWSHDSHLKIVIEPDHGQSDAVNKGFRMARGEIICWLNSDDAYLSLNSTEAANNGVAGRYVIPAKAGITSSSINETLLDVPSTPCSSLAAANFKIGTNEVRTFQVLREVFSNPDIDVVFGDALQIFDEEKNLSQRAIARFAQREDFIRW